MQADQDWPYDADPDDPPTGPRVPAVTFEKWGAPVRWVVICGVGGWVCAAPVPTRTGGTCGMPVESEPCPAHSSEVSA